VVHHTPTKASS